MPTAVDEQLERRIHLTRGHQRDPLHHRGNFWKRQGLPFSANGTTDCSGTPTSCHPLWTGTMGTTYSTSSPAVSGGVVYTESNDDKLFAFDANGSTDCSGTPATCSPLWTAALGGTPDDSSPAVADGVVYAPSSSLQAFDANGVTNCSGTPKTCTPLRSYNVTVLGSSPSVANGLVFIGSTTNASPNVFGVEAFDATGHADCSGTPTVCSPLWTGATGGPLTRPQRSPTARSTRRRLVFRTRFSYRPLRLGAAAADHGGHLAVQRRHGGGHRPGARRRAHRPG